MQTLRFRMNLSLILGSGEINLAENALRVVSHSQYLGIENKI